MISLLTFPHSIHSANFYWYLGDKITEEHKGIRPYNLPIYIPRSIHLATISLSQESQTSQMVKVSTTRFCQIWNFQLFINLYEKEF